jgi:hypothetical protein
MEPVRLQLLMRPEHRNDAGIDAAMGLARRLGLEPSGKGQVTFSARASEEELARLCGSRQSPRVPEPLREYVESISVAPVHQRF